MNALLRVRFAKPVWLSMVLCCFLPFSGLCQETAATETAVASVAQTTEFQRVAGSHSTSQIWRSIGGMLLVLGALFAASVYLKKRGGLRAYGKQRRMEVVERLTVDARRYLLLVKVERREVLVGLSPQGISALAEWVSNAEEAESDAASGGEGTKI